MRRSATALGLVVLVVAVAGLAAGSATGAANRKLVEGTVYDATCATVCAPECPPIPCGPVGQGARGAVVCARRLIVCPLARRGIECVKAPCPGTDPVYAGEGAVVKVRRRGSARVLATLPIVEGHFKIRLGPGYYEMRPFLPEPECWSGMKREVLVTAKAKGPVSAELRVANSCVVHPDATAAK
ncbi:MAG TPA: hypothetical protein VMF55_00880 [Solirubrobacterales bacterium]|nr:hypothetical protein [Solirubrobacterales bacterium]